jgi:heptaprenyl diphosphate synthase
MMDRNRTIVRIALLVALSLAVYLSENLIPVPVPIPGFKWGFSNFIILLSLSFLDFRSILWIVALKIILGNFLAGKFLSPAFFLSLSGNLGSFLSMAFLAKLNKFGYVGISITGALMNNVAQISLCSILFFRSPYIWYFFPYILFAGIFTGFLNALLAKGGEQWIKNNRL